MRLEHDLLNFIYWDYKTDILLCTFKKITLSTNLGYDIYDGNKRLKAVGYDVV